MIILERKKIVVFN